MSSTLVILWRLGIIMLPVASVLNGACAQATPPNPSPEAVQTTPAEPTAGLPVSSTGYYGVYTSNNVVLFGKLVRSTPDWITLADVHYIRSNVDPAKREVANELVKRNLEWHQPNETAVARQNILVVEPVAQDSRVMTLIREQTK